MPDLQLALTRLLRGGFSLHARKDQCADKVVIAVFDEADNPIHVVTLDEDNADVLKNAVILNIERIAEEEGV